MISCLKKLTRTLTKIMTYGRKLKIKPIKTVCYLPAAQRILYCVYIAIDWRLINAIHTAVSVISATNAQQTVNVGITQEHGSENERL